MPLTKVNLKENNKVQLKIFSGLDQRDKISDFAFTEMKNMSSESMPALAPRKSRRYIAQLSGATNVCCPEYTSEVLNSFTGIMGNKFYYNGTEILGELNNEPKTLADFNGKICIFPDKKYYDYLPDVETGEISQALVSMEKEVKVSGVSFYSSYNDMTGSYVAYCSKAGANFSESFSIGNSIVIEGCQNSENNIKTIKSRKDSAGSNDIVSAVVDKVSKDRIDLLLYNNKGEKIKFKNVTESGEITFKIAIPDMDNICVHNNRLWGTAKSGECIYASKLGDCTNFYSYQGLANDSWSSPVASGGTFTGICSYRTAVVAFKRNCIHHIYGDAPTNFSMPKQTFGGCIDGKSICEIGGVLYYLASDGFSAYSGGEPYDISPQLTTKFKSCAAETDGKNYYVCARENNGDFCVLVYSPFKNVWVKEDSMPFIDFCNYNGKVYGICEDSMWQMDGGDEEFVWCVISKRFTYDMMEYKAPNSLRITMDMEKDSQVKVYISHDNQNFKLCHTIVGNTGLYSYKVPVRFRKCDSFRIMIEGQGRVIIHQIEIEAHNGGKIYG